MADIEFPISEKKEENRMMDIASLLTLIAALFALMTLDANTKYW